jgi:transposase
MNPISFSKPILDELRKELQVAYKKDSLKVYRMIQALNRSGEERPVSEIAEFLSSSTKTIYNWAKSFICKGFSWLFREMYVVCYRKSKLTKAQKSELYLPD